MVGQVGAGISIAVTVMGKACRNEMRMVVTSAVADVAVEEVGKPRTYLRCSVSPSTPYSLSTPTRF